MPQVINGIPLNDTEGFDKITSTDKITAGYFTGGDGKLEATSIISGTLTDTQEKYYYGIAKDNITGSIQFHVAYGHKAGSGSYTNGNAVEGATEAIYKQWANILQPETEVTGGFFISRNSGLSSAPVNAQVGSGADQEIYVLTAQRSLMKDRLNKKNWTLAISGTLGNSGTATRSGSGLIFFTDDSETTEAVATPAGPRYNIVSGTLGNVSGSGASHRTYGFYYPDQGVLVFSGKELSGSVPGAAKSGSTAATYYSGSTGTHWNTTKGFWGFGTNGQDGSADMNNALRFLNVLNPQCQGYLQFRNEEDQTSVSYFCRARASHLNFSNNPTFVSGSQNELRQTTMRGNPTVFVTGVELYDGAGNVVATGKLSTPLKKNFSSEVTIKTKLTF
jgi:hypothetical protein